MHTVLSLMHEAHTTDEMTEVLQRLSETVPGLADLDRFARVSKLARRAARATRTPYDAKFTINDHWIHREAVLAKQNTGGAARLGADREDEAPGDPRAETNDAQGPAMAYVDRLKDNGGKHVGAIRRTTYMEWTGGKTTLVDEGDEMEGERLHERASEEKEFGRYERMTVRIVRAAAAERKEGKMSAQLRPRVCVVESEGGGDEGSWEILVLIRECNGNRVVALDCNSSLDYGFRRR